MQLAPREPRPRVGRGQRFLARQWLWAVLLLLAAMPSMAAMPEKNNPDSPRGRVIENASFRVIPAHPPLTLGGETLEDLGFDSVEALLGGIENRTGFIAVAFSPDGRFLASGSDDKTVKLWDLESRQLLHTFEGHESPVLSVAFSPEGRFLASGSGSILGGGVDTTIKLWDLKSRQLLHTFEGHGGSVWSVAFSPRGRFLASGSGGTFGQGDKTVKLWELESRQLLHRFEGHDGTVNSVAFSPKGRFLASGSADKTIKLWELESRQLLHTFEGHGSSVWSVAFGPKGRFLASGSLDRTVKLWDLESRQLLHTFEGHGSLVTSMAFSPRGRFLASGSGDKTVKLWDIESRQLLHSFEGHGGPVKSVAFSPKGRILASGSGGALFGLNDETVKLWDIESRQLRHSFEGHGSSVTSVAFSPRGRFLASGSGGTFGQGDKTVELWDIESRQLLYTFEGHESPVLSVAFSPRGRFLASGSGDFFGGGDTTIKLWDIESRQLLHTFEDHDGSVTSVAFNPMGRFLASGSGGIFGGGGAAIKLWDFESRQLLHTFEGHDISVTSVAFGPSGRFLASGSDDKTVKLWDLKSRQLLHSFEGHGGPVKSVAFSPKGQFLASGSGDKTVKLWDLKSRQLLHTFEGHGSSVKSVTFDPKERFLASGSDDKTVKLWDFESRQLLHTFEGHGSLVRTVAFSPKGRFLASGSDDKTVKLWDVAKKNAGTTLLSGQQGNWLTVDHRGKVLRGDDGSLILKRAGENGDWQPIPVAGMARQDALSISLHPESLAVRPGQIQDLRVQVTNTETEPAFWLHLKPSASKDDALRLDPPDTLLAPSRRLTFKGHTDRVLSVAFSPDGQFLASGADDNTVKIWDIKTNKLHHSFEGHNSYVRSVAFRPDGRFLASGADDNTVKIWDLAAHQLEHALEGPVSYTWTSPIAFSPDGRFVASGADDNTVKLWDLIANQLHHSFEGHSNKVRALAFSLNGRFLASGSGDNTIRIWDLENNQIRHAFEGHSDTVYAVAFSPDGKLVASGSADNALKLWSLTDNTLRHAFDGHTDIVHAVAFSPDGRYIASGSADKTLKLWNLGDKTLRHAFDGHADTVYAIAFSPDGRFIASGSADNSINIWDRGLRPWKPFRIARLDPGETATLHARITPNLKLPASFHPSGARDLEIVVATANGTKISRTLKVDLQSPQLEWRSAMLKPDSRTLKLDLVNSGRAVLNSYSLNLYSMTQNREGPPTERLLSRQDFEKLIPGGTNELAVVLPENVDLGESRLELRGRTRELPVFSWALASPEIERAGRLVYWVLVPLFGAVLIAVFFLRRYRHPLVVKLSAEPAALLRLPPEQLADARTRLSQTNRLTAFLVETEVTEKTLSAAIAFIAEKPPEEKVQWLARRLGAVTEAVQSSLWELHLADTFPLNLDRCLVCFPSAETTPQDLYTELHAIPQARMQPTLLLGPDSVYQRKLRAKTDDRTNKLVAPRGGELTELLLSHNPEAVLARILADQLTLAQLSPYQLGGGVNRETVFFGRQETIAHIMNRDPANYLVVSGRQLGKSSLLKALGRRYRDHPEVTCHYLALASESLVPRLAAELKLPRNARLEGIAAHVAGSANRFLFLIDEADKFVRRERERDYPVLDALRRISEEGHANFILAGFWELYEHAVLDYQSPLKNFAEIIQLGELEAEACRQLAVAPMQNMRLTYADPDLVEQLLQQTGQRANLMAIACHQILFQLKPDQRVIEADDVRRALTSDKTLNALKGWDAMTDDAEACRLDRIVVYATVEEGLFKLADLAEVLKGHGLHVDAHQLDRSLARLELGFVLAREPGGRYRYRVPLFCEMVLRDDPQARLKIELAHWR